VVSPVFYRQLAGKTGGGGATLVVGEFMKWLGLLVVVSIALAQEGKKEAQEVKAIGCVRQGVEAGCLLLRTMDGKTTYNIFASPRPELETVIAIEGKPHRGPTACMEGIAIDVTKWERSEQKCSAAAVEKSWDKLKELKSGTELRIYKKGVPILAVMDEATDDRLLVVVKNEQVVIRTMMKMTLSSDHRLIDGALAARFLNSIRKTLEEKSLWQRLT